MLIIIMKGQKVKVVNVCDFDICDMIGYVFGDVGNNFIFNLVNLFFMIFYINVFGFVVVLVGVLFMVVCFVDVFVDIMVGCFIDNLKMIKCGCFILWVMCMKFLFVVFVIFFFLLVVGYFFMMICVVYVFVIYLVWGIFYFFVNIFYGFMVLVIFGKLCDKILLFIVWSIGLVLGVVIVSYVVLFIMYGSNFYQINLY